MNLDFQTITNAIGWALVHFLWQGLAIAVRYRLLATNLPEMLRRKHVICDRVPQPCTCFFVPIWEYYKALQTTKEFIGAQVSF